MEGHVTTYGGMNMDAAYDSLPANLYIDAIDIRISTTKGESMGAFTNIQGNVESFEIPSKGDWGTAVGIPEIIGYTTIRSRIILFVADDSDSNGWIYEIQYNEATREILPGFPSLLYYNADLNFSKSHPIEALGRYEQAGIQRVYWTDYYNYLRSINISSPVLSTTPPGLIDIYPNTIFNQPLLKNIFNGGNLLSGEYQVAYRVRTADGKESLISPPSNLIHITSKSELVTQSAQYIGTPKGTNSGKALSIDILITDYTAFAEMDIFLIFHEDFRGTPKVTFIETKAIPSSGTTLNFLITGNEETAYVIEYAEYVAKSFQFKTAKTITQKDSSLVIANLKSSNFSVQDRLIELGETFDTNLLRYDYFATTDGDKFCQRYNRDAQWSADWFNSDQFKFQSDGVTLGGESANISFKFHLEQFTLDGSPIDGFVNQANVPDYGPIPPAHNLDDGANFYQNTTFPNNASPFISGLLRGYKRGETYRFGIVFYNKKGESSFVEHMCDIKFPDISEQDNLPNTSGTTYFPLTTSSGTTTYGYALGIEFTLDFSTCPNFLTEIDSYQIVRLERTNTDKRRITSGILKAFTDIPIGAQGSGLSFDLTQPVGPTVVSGGSDIYHLYPENKIGTAFNKLHGVSTPYGYMPGDFIAFHSADVSFGFDSIPGLITSTNNACILVTGALYQPSGTSQPSVSLTAGDLCENAEDYRVTCRTTIDLSSLSTENIKIWKDGKALVKMGSDHDYQGNVIGPFDVGGTATYLRNYSASYNEGIGSTGINNPQAGPGIGTPSENYEISKGGTGIIGRISRLTSDPINSGSIPQSSSVDNFSGAVTPSTGLEVNYTPIVDIVLPKGEIYGGYTDDVLATNIFIIASPIIPVSEVNPKVFGGDIFLNMFTFQSNTIELNTDFYKNSGGTPDAFGSSYSRTGAFPVESSINIDLTEGPTLKTGVQFTEDVSGIQNTVLRQETNNTNTNYGLGSSMYSYNNVYSQENNNITFFTKPLNFDATSAANDIRGYLSNVKINGDKTDAWTKFGANNYYDVDDYGPINKVINWKDTVYFIQDRGFGAYAINRAAITTTNDGVPTQLGTGQGFGKHQYFSKEHGAIHQWGVKTTDSGIYFFDGIHRKIFLFNVNSSGADGGNNPLSELKGMHSFLQLLPDGVFYRKENQGDNPIKGYGVTIGKDRINDEVIFTFLSTYPKILELVQGQTYYPLDIITYGGLYFQVTEEFTASLDPETLGNQIKKYTKPVGVKPLLKGTTIVYDELMQQFSSKYSATPRMWIENGDILLSANPTKGNIVYTHNIGNWGEFYGNVEEASITLVVNPNADINKILRTLEFNSIVRNNTKQIDRTVTITGFRIQTQVQDSGIIPFSSGRIKRRFDKWRVKLPRDINSASQQGRFRSTHFIVTLYFDNAVNKELIMNRLISYYDPQVL